MDPVRDLSESERLVFGERELLSPASESEAAECIHDSTTPLRAAGNGAHAYRTARLDHDVRLLSSAALDQVCHYEPDDYTVGVQTGMPLRRLHALLTEHGQELPVEISEREQGTVGGLVARAPVGPRTAFAGTVTSHLIGVEGITGEGTPFRSGGMVVKNVAGYQLSRLLAGAEGAGAFLTRANFKLRPIPEDRRLRVTAWTNQDDAWRFAYGLRRARLEPSTLAVITGHAPAELAARLPVPPGAWVVAWVFEGDEPTVAWQMTEAEKLLDGSDCTRSDVLQRFEADGLIDYLSRFGDPPEFSAALASVRISVRPSALPRAEHGVRDALLTSSLPVALAADVGTGILTARWSGPVERLHEPLSLVARSAQSLGGHARLLFSPPQAGQTGRPWLTELDEGARMLTQRLLHVFDPRSVLVSGAGSFDRSAQESQA